MNRERPLYGLVAQSAKARDHLRTRLRTSLPSTFPRTGWWIEPKAGVALHAPDVQHDAHSALALAGRLDAHAGAALPLDEGLVRWLCRRSSAALAALRGEFALALWDGDAERLVLARDHLGQRNIFLRDDGDVLVFSSELGPLLRDPAFSCQLDLEAALHYLACGLPPPGKTLARGITQLPAAHALSWQMGRPWSVERYWTPVSPAPMTLATDEVKAELADTLDRAIAARLDAPRPQAILLSGGLDSSYLAATLAGRSLVDAYTIEFQAGYGENETEYARAVADACGARHHIVLLDLKTARELLEPTLAAAEPCSAWATITHRRLLGAIRADGHEFLWSGLGSDEVFAGYQRMLDHYFRTRDHQKSWPEDENVDAFDALLCDEPLARKVLYPGVACFFSDAALRRSLAPPYRRWHYVSHLQAFYRECRRIKPGAHVFEMMVAHECQRRIPDLLFVDFEGVGRELGVRTTYPYLEPDFISQVACLGASSRFWHDGRRWWNKKALREIAAARVPDIVLKRLPASYNAPFADWLRAPAFGRPVFARLRRSRFWRLGFLERETLTRLEHSFARERRRQKPSPTVNQLWALLTLVSWYDMYVERAGA